MLFCQAGYGSQAWKIKEFICGATACRSADEVLAAVDDVDAGGES